MQAKNVREAPRRVRRTRGGDRMTDVSCGAAAGTLLLAAPLDTHRGLHRNGCGQRATAPHTGSAAAPSRRRPRSGRPQPEAGGDLCRQQAHRDLLPLAVVSVGLPRRPALPGAGEEARPERRAPADDHRARERRYTAADPSRSAAKLPRAGARPLAEAPCQSVALTATTTNRHCQRQPSLRPTLSIYRSLASDQMVPWRLAIIAGHAARPPPSVLPGRR